MAGGSTLEMIWKASWGVQPLVMAWLSRARCSAGQILRARLKSSVSVSIGVVATLEVLVAARLLELELFVVA